ncbi:hypothetical protein D7Z26_24605 [Cohnella endophytica]|uniref:SLH domain-containing protein n=1 Tax=Cohnella endophytica TaxID=2419778 RepID=A0A494X6E6_9BACL|nr:GLUG motif-containing protein [Cohnella endophytica]RKP46265.1 hypothetical protein D7Z26_24605 [Cohnella endophytica]
MRMSVKKVMLLMLTIMIVLGTVPGGIFGTGKVSAEDASDFSGGDGSSGNPYLIATADQLNKVRGSYLNANIYFKLTDHIDLSSYAGAGWDPIGVPGSSPFYGHIDGNGYKITGLKMDNSSGVGLGLFGGIGTGSFVANMKLENVLIKGTNIVGGLVGYNDGGTIENSFVTGSVSGTYEIGGLVGHNLNGKISNSYTSAELRGSAGVGGLVGMTEGGIIDNSFTTGSVGGLQDIGGLVGHNNHGEISNSYTSGDVDGGNNNSNVGGLVGINRDGKIANSYTSGKVSGGNKSNNVGGLVGINTDGTITNSSASGNVSGGNNSNNVGGLIGYNLNGKVSNSYASGKVVGFNKTGGLIGINERGEISGSYALGDVICGRISASVGGLIGYSVDGKIMNSYASKEVSGTLEVGGLVGKMERGEISDSYALGDVSGEIYLGGLVGYNDDAKISSSHALGNISVNGGTGSSGIGGLVGTNMTGKISYSYALGNVSGGSKGDRVGGLVGDNNRGEISNNYSSGIINGSDTVGGLVGNNQFGTISTNYGSGKVTGLNRVGGLVGWNFESTISNSYASGQVNGSDTVGGLVGYNQSAKVSNSYSSGNVSGSSMVGGLIGKSLSGITDNSFYDVQTSGQSSSEGGEGKSTVQMQKQSNYEADSANLWDFMNIWAIDSLHNGGYPYLRVFQVYLDYNGNGNSSGQAPTSQSYPSGATASVYSGTIDLVKMGYVFDGWSTQANGGGTPYKSGDSFTITYNTTLYARWLSSEATLTSRLGVVSTGGAMTESITNVPSGTTLAELKAAIIPAANATFEIYDADGTTIATTLASGKKVIVTAQDGTTKVTYIVTVVPSSAANITSFSFAEQTGTATIDAVAHTVAIKVAYGTNVTSLKAAFSLSAGASAMVDSVVQASGTTANDFTAPVTYALTAENGSTQNWTVAVTVAASSASEITAFSFTEQTGAATIDAIAHTVAIKVAYSPNVRNLVAKFNLSAGASVKVGTVDQVTGVSANDFTRPVVYIVKAANGSTQKWTVTVTVAANTEKEITRFFFDEQTGAATIDTVKHTVEIEVAFDSILFLLYPKFNLSEKASAMIDGIDLEFFIPPIDFGSPVTMVVKAEDGSTQDWTILVTVAANSAATLTSTIGTVSAEGTTNERITNIPYGTTLAALKAAITPAMGATFEIYDANGTTVANTLASGKKVIVTAQNGTTKVTYVVSVNVAPSVGGDGSTPSSDAILRSTDGRLTLAPGKAGEVSLDNRIVVSIPANATDKDVKLTIDKVTESQKLLTNNEILVSAVYEIMKNFAESFKNPITLSFTFEPASLKSNQTAAVFYYDEVKKSWIEVTGGKIIGNQITVMVDHFTKFAVFAVDHKADVPTDTKPTINLSDISGHWAETAIKQAVGNGVVTGYPDGTFKPNHIVTRAEFTVMLVNALKPQGAGTGTGEALNFTDAAKIGAWAKSAVSLAVHAGYIKGDEGGTFRPNSPITRVEMAMMVANAWGLSLETNSSSGFTDDQDIPAWAKGAVAAMRKLGLVTGRGGNKFAPVASTTRAEAVTVLLKMLAQKSQ